MLTRSSFKFAMELSQRLGCVNIQECSHNGSKCCGSQCDRDSISGLNEHYYRRYSNNNESAAIRLQNKHFAVIGEEAQINRNSEQFVKNIAHWETTVQTYKQAVDISLAGADEKSRERHVKRHGKMMITDRVKALVDNMDDFLELSVVGGIGMDYGHVPRANILTGIGKVMDQYCLISAMDGAFKGGAVFPITLKKQLRAHEIAQQNRLPCIYIVDSAGAFLPLQAEIFNLGGQGFYNEAVMSALKIPQIAIVCGSCTAGGAYIPTMADEAVIVDKTGTIFLGGPPLVQAALGEIISAEDLGGAKLHCSVSGCTDYFAKNETEAFQIARNIVATLNLSTGTDLGICDYDDPIYDIEDIPGILPSPNTSPNINMYQIISRLVDGSRFHEFKALYGRLLITGFAHIQGHLVGIIANQGKIDDQEAAKGAHFVQLCCERDVPLVFLQNTVSDIKFSSQAQEDVVAASISLKCRARMLAAVSCAEVPKLTVVIGNSFGSDHYLMGGRSVSPNFLFAWPNAHVAIMEPDKLAQTIIQERSSKDGTDVDLKKLSIKLQRESSTIFGATRILNDGIILPQETRKVLSQCLAICQAYRPKKEQHYPVFRM